MFGRYSLVLFSLLAPTTAAQARLLADINPGPGPYMSSEPSAFAGQGAGTYFAATTYAHGRELWHLDAAGVATLAADVASGPEWSTPEAIAAFGSGVVFAASRADVGRELWRIDGAGLTLHLVADIARGGASSSPTQVVAAGGRVFCVADDGVFGRELWVSDGTPAGTHLVLDIRAGAAGAAIDHLIEFAGNVAFFADDGVHGRELWASDGTATGTRMLEANPGAAGGGGTLRPVVENGRVYFMATDGTSGLEPWVSSGTPAGTHLLADINPGSGDSLFDNGFVPRMAALGGGKVLFAATDGASTSAHGLELWITDGTAVGTVLVRDLEPGTNGSGPWDLAATGDGRAFFQAQTSASGRELYLTDGTASGTVLLELTPGVFDTYIGPIAIAQGRAFFGAAQNSRGPIGLWTSEGTLPRLVSPTGMIVDSAPVARGSGVVVAGATPLEGLHAWVSDGTSAGTRLAFDVELTRGPASSNPVPIAAFANRVVFAADDGSGTRLWASDGHAVQPLGTPASSATFTVAALNDMLLLYTGFDLVRTDATPLGTGPLGFLPGTRVGARLDGAHAIFPDACEDHLAATDGLSVREVRYVGGSCQPNSGARMTGFTSNGGVGYFTANDGVHGEELWRSDGTAAGTYIVRDLQPPGINGPPWVYGMIGDRVILAADDGTGLALWASDGTAAGTLRLPAPHPQLVYPFVDAAVVAGRMVVMVADGLVATDGTAVGTMQIMFQAIPPAAYLCALADAAVMVDTSGSAPRLFRTDGTAAGTVQVPYAFPGTILSKPIVADSHTAVFAVADGPATARLVATDGSASGTRTLTPLSLPYWSLSTWRPVAAGGQLFFAQRDFAVGTELWALDLGASAQAQGVGCGATPLGFPLHATAPRLGSTLTLRAPTALPVEALALGLPPPVPIATARARGCALFLDPAQSIVFVPLPGTVAFDLPANPGLVGARLAAQALAGPSAPLGFDLSNGLTLTLGN